MVSMIFQPPHTVPAALAAWARKMTQIGGSNEDASVSTMNPPANKVAAMMPIVFCASLDPCPQETHAEVPTWAQRKNSESS